MLTQTQEQILEFLLANPEEQVTIRGISRILNKSYTLIYNNLKDLEKKEIINKQDVPPAKIIKLNEFAPTNVLINIELKRKNTFLKKHPWIQLMLKDILESTNNPFFILLIFGSYAKGKQTSKSDLDLLIIVQNKREIKEIENAIQKSYTKVKKSMNIVDINNFTEMIQNTEELNIGNEARKYHVILHGAEDYYQILKKVYRR
ncbi:nucleotidyltransferase domain-containing protein [Candidatus Woesearchaeota archaeon]|nr:nucleotidyltransferase domain-containing protein [Candidatus Woesearchaeota archaeon]